MKSVTVKDHKGKMIFKAIEHKGGMYEAIYDKGLLLYVEIRDDKNQKVILE